MAKINIVEKRIKFNNAVKITELCLSRYKEMAVVGSFETIYSIKTIFDILVSHFNTNAKLECVSETTDENGRTTLNLSLNGETIDEFIAMGIGKTLEKKIVNYTECLNGVWKAIELFALKDTLEDSLEGGCAMIAERIPTADSMREGVKASVLELQKLGKEQPELFKLMLEKAQYENAIKATEAEIRATRAKREKLHEENQAKVVPPKTE